MNDNGKEGTAKDLTENLSDRQLLLLLLERVGGIDERLIRLEEAEEERKRETRPLWARLDGQMVEVLARLAAIEEGQMRTRLEIGLLREDLHNEKMERATLGYRVSVLERSVA